MKIDQIPDIYIEQYILGELPENLRKEMDELILKNPGLNERIGKVKKSNEDILKIYPADQIVREINRKAEIRNNNGKASPGFISRIISSINNLIRNVQSVSSRRYILATVSAAAVILGVILMIPGIFNIENNYKDDVRIKGLDSKLLLFRMKGKDIEELKNFDSARRGDVIQVGYIAAGNFRHGMILSIDGRGTVTVHLPEAGGSDDNLVLNRKVLLNKSYELDDSPSFERFIMILSDQPIDTGTVIEKAKKLAKSGESAVNGLIETEKNSIEFSITVKKTE